MKNKILISLGLMGLMVSNIFADEVNNIKKDMFLVVKTEDFQNLKVDLNLISYQTGFSNINHTTYLNIKTTDFNSVGIGLNNIAVVGYKFSNYKINYGLDFEKFNNDKDKNAELKLYGGYITNEYPILNQKISLYSGIELVNVFNEDVKDFHKINTNFRFGAFVNNKIYLGYKAKETKNGIDNLIQVQYVF